MQLDVWSDLACPWCFLGKRRLAQALRGRADVEVRWRAFELNPDFPADGAPRSYLEVKLGGAERLRRAQQGIAALGLEAGIRYAFEKQSRLPNTRLAHRAIAVAPASQKDALVEALFRAHFEEGLDLSPLDNVLAVSRAAGVPVDLEGDAGLAQVLEDEALAAQLGIAGVPCFVADQRTALSGAQDVATMGRFLTAAAG